MTLIDYGQSQSDTGTKQDNGRRGRQPRRQAGRQLRQREQQPQQQEINVGQNERVVSTAAGSVLALLGMSRRSLPGLLVASVGGAMIYRGATGHCPMYESLGVDTAGGSQEQKGREAEDEISERGIHVEQAFLINRSPEDLYSFWRKFDNLPQIMTHIDRIEVQGDRRSHWVARLTRMAGGKLEWDAEITRDDPNSLIAWRSLPGSEIDTTGEIRFAPAMGDRGTEVHVFMDFVPPAGTLARMVPSLFSKATRRMMRTDLRRFKQLMEIGEIPTIDGQPHGTCTGTGTRYRES